MGKENGELSFEDLPAVPFGTFGPELDNLITAAANKLDREWPAGWPADAQAMVRSLVLIAQNTYNAVRFLTADEPAPGRKLEYGVAVGPLVRSLLDTLFTIVFLFEDLPSRTEWFMHSGWREVAEELERHQDRYSDSEGWAEWLDGFSDFVERMRIEWGVTEEEAGNPKKIRYWPTPGQMTKSKDTSSERIEFLQFLTDLFYRTLSAESHLSWPGIALRSHFLFERKPDVLKKSKSDAVALAVTLMLCIVSELEIEMQWSLRERLLHVWEILKSDIGFTEEVFDQRYEGRL